MVSTKTSASGNSILATSSTGSDAKTTEKYRKTSTKSLVNDHELLDMILADTYTRIMGGIVGFMLIITVLICFKTRILKKKKDLPKNPVHFQNHLEDVRIDQQAEERGGRRSNEYVKNVTNDHEDYALVDHSEKCYADLEPGEYDLLRSHRKCKKSEPAQDSCYDKMKNENSPYDISGLCRQKDVLNTDDEYEMVKNMAKKTQSKDLTESEQKFSLRDTGTITGDNSYQDAISKEPSEDKSVDKERSSSCLNE